jgi:hypothetical protein
MGVKLRVTRAGKKSETPGEPDGNPIPRTPMSESLDPEDKVLRSMTKQLEEALMQQLTPVQSTVESPHQPKFGMDKGRRGFTTTSKQNRKNASARKVEFDKNGKPTEPSTQQVPLIDQTPMLLLEEELRSKDRMIRELQEQMQQLSGSGDITAKLTGDAASQVAYIKARDSRRGASQHKGEESSSTDSKGSSKNVEGLADKIKSKLEKNIEGTRDLLKRIKEVSGVSPDLDARAVELGMEGNPLFEARLAPMYERYRRQWAVPVGGVLEPERMLTNAREADGLMLSDITGVLYCYKLPVSEVGASSSAKTATFEYSKIPRHVRCLKPLNPDNDVVINSLLKDIVKPFHAPVNMDLIVDHIRKQQRVAAVDASLLDIASSRMKPTQAGRRVDLLHVFEDHVKALAKRYPEPTVSTEVRMVAHVLGRWHLAIRARDLHLLNTDFTRLWDSHHAPRLDHPNRQEKIQAFKIAVHWQAYVCDFCGTLGSTDLWCMNMASKACGFVGSTRISRDGASQSVAGSSPLNPAWTVEVAARLAWADAQTPPVLHHPEQDLARKYKVAMTVPFSAPGWSFPTKYLTTGNATSSWHMNPFEAYVEKQRELLPHPKVEDWPEERP